MALSPQCARRSDVADLTPQQVCTSCGGNGPFRGRRKDCRKCESQKARARQVANPERTRASNKKWREENPELVKAQDARRRSRPGHADRQRRWRRDHYLANTDRYKNQARAYERANPRPPRRISVEHCHGDDAQYAEIVLRDPCSYCGHPADTVDHIVPASVGGTNTFDNFTGACRSCNSRKHTKGLLEWLAVR